jgi:hypothetical protein
MKEMARVVAVNCRCASTSGEKLIGTPFGNVPDPVALKSSEEHMSCSCIVPTPFERLNDGALMGDVLLCAFHLAFGFIKPQL